MQDAMEENLAGFYAVSNYNEVMNLQAFEPDKLYRDFERSWLTKNPVTIEKLIGPSDVSPVVVEELVHIELEFSWKQFFLDQELGQTPAVPERVKGYLARFPKLDSPEIILNLLRSEVFNMGSLLPRKKLFAQYMNEFPNLIPDLVTAHTLLITKNELFKPGDRHSQSQEFSASADNTLLPAAVDTTLPPPQSTLHPGDSSKSDGNATQSPVEAKRIGGYRVLQELGRGGMGVVYQAKDEQLQRVVAIKMILAGIHTGVEDLKRFRREAASVAKLKHDAIVQVFEYGVDQSSPYIVFEYVDGGSLGDLIAGGKLIPLPQVLTILDQITSGVAFAHFHGIIHRDLKPENILLNRSMGAKITDFGLAKDFQNTQASLQTATNAVLGTPAFMSPEQAEGNNHQVDHRTDIFSIGSIMYTLLTGQYPFEGDSAIDVMLAVQEDDPLPPRQLNRKVPVELELICLKCLEKDKERRYQTTEELRLELAAFASGKTIATKRTSAIVRARRWYQKNQIVALFGAGAIGVLFMVAIGSVIFTLNMMSLNDDLSRANREAKRSLEQARFAENEAIKSRNTAVASQQEAVTANENAQKALKEAELQREQRILQAYSSNMLLIPYDWKAGNLRRIQKNLNSYADDGTLRNFEWYYWKRVIAANQEILTGHSHTVSAVLCVNNNRIVTLDYAGELFIWDGKQLKNVQRVKNHDSDVRAIAGDSRGTLFFTGGSDGRLVCQDNNIGDVIWSKEFSDIEIHSLAFDSDRNLLAVGTNRGSVTVLNTTTQEIVSKFATPHGICRCLKILPSGKLAVAGNDSRISIWEMSTGAQEQMWPAFQGPIWDLQNDPEGRYLFSAGQDGTIKKWNLESLGLDQTLNYHSFKVRKMAVSPDAKLLVAVSDDQTISVWDIASGELATVFKGHTDSILSVDFSESGEQIVTGSADKSVRIWDINARQEFIQQITPSGRMRFLEQGPKNSLVVGSDTELEVFSSTGEVIYRWEPSDAENRIVSLAVSRNGENVFAGTFSGDVFVWDTAEWSQRLIQRFAERPAKLACSSAGDLLAVSSGNSQFQIWQVRDLDDKPLYSGSLGDGGIQKLWFTPDGDEIYLSTKDYKLQRFSLEKLEGLPNRFKSGTSLVVSADWSADGRYLATGGFDKLIRIWDLQTGENISTLLGHTNSVSSLSFSKNGSRLVSSQRGDTIRIWDWKNKREVMNVVEPDSACAYVGFSTLDGQLIFGSPEKGIKILDGRPLPE